MYASDKELHANVCNNCIITFDTVYKKISSIMLSEVTRS